MTLLMTGRAPAVYIEHRQAHQAPVFWFSHGSKSGFFFFFFFFFFVLCLVRWPSPRSRNRFLGFTGLGGSSGVTHCRFLTPPFYFFSLSSFPATFRSLCSLFFASALSVSLSHSGLNLFWQRALMMIAFFVAVLSVVAHAQSAACATAATTCLSTATTCVASNAASTSAQCTCVTTGQTCLWHGPRHVHLH